MSPHSPDLIALHGVVGAQSPHSPDLIALQCCWRAVAAPGGGLKIYQATLKPPLFLKAKNITYFYHFKEMHFCCAWRYLSKTDCNDKGNCMLMYFVVYDVKMSLVKRHEMTILFRVCYTLVHTVHFWHCDIDKVSNASISLASIFFSA